MGNRLLIEDKLDTMNENLEKMADGMRKISLAIGGEVEKPSTWEEIRILCRNNNIRGLLEVGDVVEFTLDGEKLNAVVVDFIEEGQHSNGLKLRDGLQTGVIFQTEKILMDLQFDAQEAFYCAVDGLVAGTYCFTFKDQTWFAGDVNQTYNFTLTKDTPKGAQFVFTHSASTTADGKTINVFASGVDASAQQTAVLSSGASGTNLGELKNVFNGNFNSCQRAFCGNNRYKESAIRQFLNSDGEKGEFWTPQNKWDRRPSWYATQKGFLNGMQKDLLDNIASVDRHVYKNTLCDDGGVDEITEKIFLLARNEVFMSQEGADDTLPLAFFKDNSVSAVPHAADDPCRIKNKKNGTAQYWWIESPSVGSANIVRYVSTSGANNSTTAYNTSGVAPAFVIA